MIDLRVKGKNEVLGPGEHSALCAPGSAGEYSGEARGGLACAPARLSGLAPFPGRFSSRQGANMNQLEELLFY